MVDARDLKSLGSYELCEFESHSGHLFLSGYLFIINLLWPLKVYILNTTFLYSL